MWYNLGGIEARKARPQFRLKAVVFHSKRTLELFLVSFPGVFTCWGALCVESDRGLGWGPLVPLWWCYPWGFQIVLSMWRIDIMNLMQAKWSSGDYMENRSRYRAKHSRPPRGTIFIPLRRKTTEKEMWISLCWTSQASRWGLPVMLITKIHWLVKKHTQPRTWSWKHVLLQKQAVGKQFLSWCARAWWGPVSSALKYIKCSRTQRSLWCG